jgi:hypothetical protein
VAGREFDAGDTKTSRSAPNVDQAFVRRFFPRVSAPVGLALSFDDSKPEDGERTSIVGVVENIRHDGPPPAPRRRQNARDAPSRPPRHSGYAEAKARLPGAALSRAAGPAVDPVAFRRTIARLAPRTRCRLVGRIRRAPRPN